MTEGLWALARRVLKSQGGKGVGDILFSFFLATGAGGCAGFALTGLLAAIETWVLILLG